jgi:hypothetical protein
MEKGGQKEKKVEKTWKKLNYTVDGRKMMGKN